MASQALQGNPLLIVDEPTAGLRSGGTAALPNILAEVGEETVVILSRTSLMMAGTLRSDGHHGAGILKLGEPLQLMRELNGKLWTQVVARGS